MGNSALTAVSVWDGLHAVRKIFCFNNTKIVGPLMWSRTTAFHNFYDTTFSKKIKRKVQFLKGLDFQTVDTFLEPVRSYLPVSLLEIVMITNFFQQIVLLDQIVVWIEIVLAFPPLLPLYAHQCGVTGKCPDVLRSASALIHTQGRVDFWRKGQPITTLAWNAGFKEPNLQHP